MPWKGYPYKNWSRKNKAADIWQTDKVKKTASVAEKKLFTTVIGTGDHDRSQKTGHKNADAVIVMIAQTGYDPNRTYRKVIGPRLFG